MSQSGNRKVFTRSGKSAQGKEKHPQTEVAVSSLGNVGKQGLSPERTARKDETVNEESKEEVPTTQKAQFECQEYQSVDDL